MTRPCLNIRFHLIPSVLALLFISPGQAAEIPLRAFNASYDLYQGGMHVAISELSLQPSDESWQWRMSTQARGIYALFTNKIPYSETTFTQTHDSIRLQQIVIADSSDKDKYESAKFDWDKGKIEVLRRGKQKQLPLNASVYDYQSIHLLAASMGARQQANMTFDFYRKGKLAKSRFVYSGEGKVAIDGETIKARIYEQMIVKSNSKIKYYYDAGNPLLPLRIEKLEPGESTTVLTLSKIEWTL